MRKKGLTGVGIISLSLLLIFSGYFLSQLSKFQVGGEDELKKYSMFLNKYKITRSNSWDNTFSREFDHQTTAKFQEKGSQLIIDSKYLAQIGHQNEHYEQQTISNVLEISTQSNTKKHFIVQSEGNQQLFYLPQTPNPTKTPFSKLEKCLQLDSVQLKDKLHYFVDNLNNFWLISHPHNNVLFVQIYDCEHQKLVRKIFHEPKYHNRKYMINELIEVRTGTEGKYKIKLLTYDSHEYIVEIQEQTYQITSYTLNPSHEISSKRIEITKNQPQSSLSYKFIDPLNKIFEREFYSLLFKSIQRYLGELKGLLGAFGFDSKQINTFIKEKIKQYEKEADPEQFDYDLQLIDQNNQCILNLQYHLDDENEKNSSLTKLSKYLLSTRTPIFHNISNYDEYDIVEVLKNEKTLSVHQFKRMPIDNGFEKEYTSNYFYSVYHTYPDSKAHFLGVGQKVFYLHPANERIKNEDFFTVRTRTGGLVLQGTQIKGLYEDKPLLQRQVHQKYFIESNQVIPGIWQAHAGYQTLISSPKGNKVQLINGLNGKAMIVYNIDAKQGYQYANSFLFNNEWWIVIFNKNTKMSELVKYELYVQKTYPKQVDFVRRTYGKIVESEFDQNEDDLARILKQYVSQVSFEGIVILDIFRCLDQFYYVQMCDTKGGNYAIARIHYKRFSNRLPKKSNQYSNDLESRLIVEPKNMVKQTQSLDPFLFVLEGQSFYEGISDLIKEGKFEFSNYSTSIQDKVITSLQKLNQFDFLPYSVISHQQQLQVSSKESTSVQEVTLLSMRVLVENAKKKFMIETKVFAKNCLMYFTLFIIIILISLIVKLLIQGDSKKETQKDESKDKESSNQKGKKKQKTK